MRLLYCRFNKLSTDTSSEVEAAQLSPLCQFPNLINYHQQTLQYQQLVDTTDGLINSWLIRKSPYQQLVVDKELIVDKVVLINKEP